jgi:hypothetical protein
MKEKIFNISYTHNANINYSLLNSPMAKKIPIIPNNPKSTTQNPNPKFKIQKFKKLKGFQILHKYYILYFIHKYYILLCIAMSKL